MIYPPKMGYMKRKRKTEKLFSKKQIAFLISVSSVFSPCSSLAAGTEYKVDGITDSFNSDPGTAYYVTLVNGGVLNVDHVLLGSIDNTPHSLSNGSVLNILGGNVYGDIITNDGTANQINFSNGATYTGHINTLNGSGVYINGGDVSIEDSVINGSILAGGALSITGSKIDNSSGDGSAINFLGVNEALVIDNANILANSSASYTALAVNAEGAQVRITDSSVIENSSSVTGVAAVLLLGFDQAVISGTQIQALTREALTAVSGELVLQNSNITSSGNIAYYHADGDTIISGSRITSGAQEAESCGASGQDDCSAISFRGGSLKITDGSQVESNFTGILVRSSPDNPNYTSSLLIDNSIISGGEEAIQVESDIKNSTITLQNHAVLNSSSGTLINILDDAQSNVTIDNSSLSGNIIASDTADFNLTMRNNAVLAGNLSGADSLNMASGSRWSMAGNNTVGSLTMDNATVDFNSGEGFRTLTAGSLNGSGSFLMHTDLAAGNGDLLNITGEANGNHLLAIRNTGAEPANGSSDLQVVHSGSGNAQFAVNGGKVDAGAWQYSLTQRDHDWYLTQDASDNPDDPDNPDNPSIPDRSTTPSTDAVLSMASAPVYIFNSELQNLRFRHGDVRDNSISPGGVWGRYLGSDNRISGAAGSAYRMNQNGMELGGDTVIDMPNGRLALGAFVSFSDNSIRHARGGNSSVNSSSGGLYSTWLDNSGLYVDAVLKASHFSNDLQTRMTDGTPVKGDYSQNGFGGSLESGMTFSLPAQTWVQPFIRATAFRAGGINLSLDNGMKARISTTKSMQGEAGVSAGMDLSLSGVPVKPYVKAAFSHEFADNNTVRINDSWTFNNDISGTTGKYGAGVSAQLTKNAGVWVEADYQKGNRTESPVTANAGFRINF